MEITTTNYLSFIAAHGHSFRWAAPGILSCGTGLRIVAIGGSSNDPAIYAGESLYPPSRATQSNRSWVRFQTNWSTPPSSLLSFTFLCVFHSFWPFSVCFFATPLSRHRLALDDTDCQWGIQRRQTNQYGTSWETISIGSSIFHFMVLWKKQRNSKYMTAGWCMLRSW